MATVVDTLSEVVRSIRLRGNIYARWELTAPWGIALPGGEFAAFHLVEEGECWLATADGRSEVLRGGELVVLFDGTAHGLSDRPGRATTPIEELLARQAPGSRVCRHGGGGEGAHLVCGKFSIEGRRRSGFSALPSLVRLDGTGAAGHTISLLASEIASGQPGSAALAERLSEVLFVQVLRGVVGRLSAPGRSRAGWLRGAEDEHVWAALGLIHSAPERAWTIEALARRVGRSRSSRMVPGPIAPRSSTFCAVEWRTIFLATSDRGAIRSHQGRMKEPLRGSRPLLHPARDRAGESLPVWRRGLVQRPKRPRRRHGAPRARETCRAGRTMARTTTGTAMSTFTTREGTRSSTRTLHVGRHATEADSASDTMQPRPWKESAQSESAPPTGHERDVPWPSYGDEGGGGLL